MIHSERAKFNMTAQMKAQWDFLNKNLLKKQKRLVKFERYRIFKLPGFNLMIKICQRGIKKINKDIMNKKVEIFDMQEKGQINIII